MDIHPIRTQADHEAALAEIERLWNAEPGTPEHDCLEVLGVLVNAYEERRWPVEAADPVEAIRFQMDQAGYSQTDLGALLGSRSRASEILSRKRPLTMDMAAKLHRAWRIPAECLLAPPAATVRSGARRGRKAPAKRPAAIAKAARRRA